MKLDGINVGIAITGSFCTYEKIKAEIIKLKSDGANITAIFSDNAASTDTRFGTAESFVSELAQLTEKQPILTMVDVEPLGPNNELDILLLAPCTGNTLAKLCCGISDTSVLMAAKGHLRNVKPLVISISTNDALGINFKNIGQLLNMKNIYFVPFGQDNFAKKPNSMIAHTNMIIPTLEAALDGKQIQPVIKSPH